MKIRTRYLGVVLAMTTLGVGEAWAQECDISSPQSVAHGDAPASTSPAPASQSEEQQTLLSGNLAHGGFGAPQVKVTSLAGQAGLLVGGRGAWIIGHSLTLGGAGYGLPTRVDAPEEARSSTPNPAATRTALTLGYGGFRVGYIFFPREVVHFSAGLLIGGGGISVVERRAQSDIRTLHTASVFVLEPEAAIEFNITPSIRGAFDLSYRYMSDSGIPGLSSSRIGGPAAGAFLAFGWF